MLFFFIFSISESDKENGFSFLVSLKQTSPHGSVKPLSKVLQVETKNYYENDNVNLIV